MQYMRWNTTLEKLAERYVRDAIGIPFNEKTPPVSHSPISILILQEPYLLQYITVHARRSDFDRYCGKSTLDDCLVTLPTFASRVREVQEELARRKGIHVHHVFMTSDEKNASWWEDVANMGWYKLNQTKIIGEHGRWLVVPCPPISLEVLTVCD
jgi:hypothetical protein